MQLDLPQLDMQVDRKLATHLGLNAKEIVTAITMYARGIDVADFNDNISSGQRYNIRLKADDAAITQVANLRKIYLRNSTGKLARLDDVVSFKPSLELAVIGRYDLQYAVHFYANPLLSINTDHLD